MAKNAITDWSTTAASNTDVGGVNIDEGCAPSGINNAIRELMAQVATGLGNGGFVKSIDQLTALTSPADGDTLAIADASDSNTVKKVTISNLRKWLGVPIGAGMDWWTDTPPDGWIFAYGQAISRTTYSALFAVYSTTHGSGDGSTTFNVPDKRGRVSFGKDNMGGTSADRLTDQGSAGIDGDTLGATGGAETHTLTEAEMPSHDHDFTQYWGSNGSGGPFLNRVGDNGTTQTTQTTGGGGAHNNLPPGIVCNYIIFTGV